MPRNSSSSLHTVKPFEYSFVLTNRRTGRQSHYVSLDDVLIAVRGRGWAHEPDFLPHRFSPYPRLTPYEKERMCFEGPLWHVCNHLGRVIEQHELEDRLAYLPLPQPWRRPFVYEKEPQGLSKRLIRIKGSSQKIKSTYQHVKKIGWHGHNFGSVCSFYRHVRTQNERRHTHNHFKEWGQFKGMARAGRKKLPTYYDDTLVGSHKTAKSWKHHSKRRKQWIGK